MPRREKMEADGEWMAHSQPSSSSSRWGYTSVEAVHVGQLQSLQLSSPPLAAS